MTIRDEIVDAIVSAINAADPTGVQAERDKMHPVDNTGLLPSIGVYLGREDTAAPSPSGGKWGHLAEHMLSVKIEILAFGKPVTKALDPLAARVVKAISGQEFGGLANRIFIGSKQWTYNDTDRQVCELALDVAVEYTTAAKDEALLTD